MRTTVMLASVAVVLYARRVGHAEVHENFSLRVQ